MSKTLKDLPVGARVRDPESLFLDAPVTWLVAAQNHPGHPNGSAALLSERLVFFAYFDTPERGNPAGEYAMSGNDRYRLSNLLQWLNSSADAGQWYAPQHEHDVPPDENNLSYDSYARRAGFLHGFSERFRSGLLETGTSCAYYENNALQTERVISKLFLPAIAEVTETLDPDLDPKEGELLPLFSDDGSRLAYPTPEAARETSTSADSAAYWWLRTPSPFGRGYERVVTTSGSLNESSCDSSNVGARPMCCLRGDTPVSDEPDAQGVYTILWNAPPVLSGADGELGVKAEGFGYAYTVSDAESERVTVTESLDGELLRSFEAVCGAELSLEVRGETFLRLANGPHTLTISADDGAGGVSARAVTFRKDVRRLSVTWAQPVPTQSLAEKIALHAGRHVPEGAVFRAEACNNGFDEAPVWEDITGAVEAGSVYTFANTAAQAGRGGVNVHLSIERGEALEDCILRDVSVIFG